MTRPTFEQYLLQLAVVSASRATCPKRQVGAVVADADRVIRGTGYNGSPRGLPHCIDNPCPAVTLSAPQSHVACDAVHAEMNAIIAAGHACRGGTIAITTSPCKQCASAIVNAGICRVIFAEENRLFRNTSDYGRSPAEILRLAGVSYQLIAIPT